MMAGYRAPTAPNHCDACGRALDDHLWTRDGKKYDPPLCPKKKK